MELPIENQRLKEIVNHYSNGNILQFSKKIEVSQPRISRLFILDKRSGKYPLLSFDIIQSTINKFINVNSEWLITGKGEMLKQETNAVQLHNTNLKIADKVLSNQDIPLFDFQATVGLRKLLDSSKPHEVLDTIRIPNLPPCDGAISVRR